jgi:hypothetical protein
MEKRTARLRLLIWCGLFLAPLLACIPSRLAVRREDGGRVLDAATNRPVPGATVVVESWQVVTPGGQKFKLKDVFTTKTDGTGSFYIPAKREWFAVIPIPDLPPAFNRRVCVAANGYELLIADPWATRRDSPWAFQFPQPWRLFSTPTPKPSPAPSCPFGTP